MTDRQAYSRVRIGNEWDGFGAIIISAPSGEIWKIFKNMKKYWKYGKILFFLEKCGNISKTVAKLAMIEMDLVQWKHLEKFSLIAAFLQCLSCSFNYSLNLCKQIVLQLKPLQNISFIIPLEKVHLGWNNLLALFKINVDLISNHIWEKDDEVGWTFLTSLN